MKHTVVLWCCHNDKNPISVHLFCSLLISGYQQLTAVFDIARCQSTFSGMRKAEPWRRLHFNFFGLTSFAGSVGHFDHLSLRLRGCLHEKCLSFAKGSGFSFDKHKC